MTEVTYQALKDRHRAEREAWNNENLSLRIHRSLSWLGRAEQLHQEDGSDDPDTRFILTWIAFNAAYASDIKSHAGESEREQFIDFIKDLHSIDTKRRLHDLIWTSFSGVIRTLLDNRYLFEGFWRHHRGDRDGYGVIRDWQEPFERANIAARRALEQQDTVEVLSISLSRVYMLRNQIVHGGATWNSGKNRQQVRDGAALMGRLVPAMLQIMMDRPAHYWPAAAFPVVGS